MQKKQWPHAIVNGTTTRSPTFSRVLSSADLDDLAHELVAEDVALLHGRDVAVVDVQIGSADGGRGDLDDGVARIEDLRDRERFRRESSLCLPSTRLACRPPMRVGVARGISPASSSCLKSAEILADGLRRFLAEERSRERSGFACRRLRTGDGR